MEIPSFAADPCADSPSRNGGGAAPTAGPGAVVRRRRSRSRGGPRRRPRRRRLEDALACLRAPLDYILCDSHDVNPRRGGRGKDVPRDMFEFLRLGSADGPPSRGRPLHRQSRRPGFPVPRGLGDGDRCGRRQRRAWRRRPRQGRAPGRRSPCCTARDLSRRRGPRHWLWIGVAPAAPDA